MLIILYKKDPIGRFTLFSISLMKKIYYQTGQWKNTTIDCYQIKNSVQKISINSSVEKLLIESRSESDSIFLLDENYFDLIALPIAWSFYDPISISTLDILASNKIKELKKDKKIYWEMLSYATSAIMIDGIESSYILGKTGYISFQLSLLCLKPTLLLSCPHILEPQWPKVYPATYFTLQFITHNLEKKDFCILTINEDTSKLIHIYQWRYQAIESLDWWYKHIKEMFRKNNILNYFYKSNEEIQSNPIAYSIVQQSMQFYNKMLIEWIASFSTYSNDIIVIAPQLKHSLFWESFTDIYSKEINGYVVPFSITDTLNNHGKQRQPSELDILTCLNFAK